jgi:hypothetical protein
MASEGFFPRPPTIFFFVLGGTSVVITDANVADADLLEPATLPFAAGFSSFGFDVVALDAVDAVLGCGEDRPAEGGARVWASCGGARFRRELSGGRAESAGGGLEVAGGGIHDRDSIGVHAVEVARVGK